MPKTRLSGEVSPKARYRPFLAFVFAISRFGDMPRGPTEDRGKLDAFGNRMGDISKKGFKTADLLPEFVNAGGSETGLANLLPMGCDLKEQLLSGRLKVLTQADRNAWHYKENSKRASFFYNWSPRQRFGDYENWACGKPVEDWRLAAYKRAYGDIDTIVGMGRETAVRETPLLWGPVYQW